nr:PREDICTED: cilia- and flagella-associated protein 46 [Latimeria chalumnae]|eukprot:XP_014352574.1 PREDICTED: cilia- and flagella-associated protein 46 [Latimeria chalumnae]
MVRLFLKPGFRHLLIPSLTQIVKALEDVKEQDLKWRAQLMIELVECLLDSGKSMEAAEFAEITAEFIKVNVPWLYQKIFSLQVRYSLIDPSKADIESKSSIVLSVVCEIQILKLHLEAKETIKDATARLNYIYELLTMSETKCPSFSLDNEKVPLFIDVARLSLEINCIDVAFACITELKRSKLTDRRKLIEVECLECEYDVQKLGNKAETYSKGIVEKRLKAIKKLELILQYAVQEREPNLIQVVCVALWNICLPLLQQKLRKQVEKPLICVAKSLEEIDSLLNQLRCQIHMELAQIEEDEDRIESSIEQLQKAQRLDENGKYKERLEIALHRLHLCAMLYKTPDRPEDQASMIIEQAKRGSKNDTVRKKRLLLAKVGIILAPDAFQAVLDAENEAKVTFGRANTCVINQLCAKAEHHTSHIQMAAGHLSRLGDENDKERVRLWADLAKTARGQEVWDVCRAACRFCLLYDDGRWKVSKSDNKGIQEGVLSSGSYTVQQTSGNETSIIRMLAEIRFINGEATVHLLRSEGILLNDHIVLHEYKSKHPMGSIPETPQELQAWTIYRDWIAYLSQYTTENFMRAAELGVELNEVWLVCNAAVYIWNHNNHLLASGRQTELVNTLQTLLNYIKKTGHNGDAVLLVMICNALAQGLIRPWISSQLSKTEKKDVVKTPIGDKNKKGSAKGPEKPVVAQTMSVNPDSLSDVKNALEVCEFALDLTSGTVPSDVVPIAVRHHVVITWVKVKQLLQEQIGRKLGTDEEDFRENETFPCIMRSNSESLNLMTKVLVALQMYSCNDSGLMEFSVPSLPVLVKMTSDCSWTDPLVEMHTWTHLAYFAYKTHDHELAMTCVENALQLDSIKDANVTLKKQNLDNYLPQQEILSCAVCIKGQIIVENLTEKKHKRKEALEAFELSASYAEKAGSIRHVMVAARHFWNTCLPFIPYPTEREQLRHYIINILKAINNTSSFAKKTQHKTPQDLLNHHQSRLVEHQGGTTTGSSLSARIVHPEDDLSLIAAFYGFLFHIYADNKIWNTGLKVLNEAIQNMPRTKHRLLIFKHRIIVKAKLGHSFMMDIQKFQDESEDYFSNMWKRVGACCRKTTEQLACYQNALEVLQKPESNWQKIDYLIEFGEWLYCNHFPITDAINQLEWAVEILLNMNSAEKSKDGEDMDLKIKLKSKTKFSPDKGQRSEEDLIREALTPEEETEEESLILSKKQLKIDVEVMDSSLSIKDLRTVRELEALFRAHTLIALISGFASPLYQQHCLMAYAYIMRIWQISLEAAALIINERNPPPPSQSRPTSAPRKEKGKKGNKKASTPVMKEKPKRKAPLDTMPSNTDEWAAYDCPEEVRDVFKHDSDCCTINKNTIIKPEHSLYYINLLVKELYLMSLTHLIVPVLQLAEIIAHEVLDSKSLSDLYHLRIAQTCMELNLRQSAQLHEKAAGTVFISEKEQAKCRLETALLETANVPSEPAPLDTTSDNSTSIGSNQKKKDLKGYIQTGKQRIRASILDMWLDKAEIYLQLGLYQPARELISEAYTHAYKTQSNEALARCLYLLAMLANSEKNHGQAKTLLEEAQKIGGDEHFWYNTTLCLLQAILGEDSKDKEILACKILQHAVKVFRSALAETPNRVSVLGFMIASLEVRLVSIRIESIKSSSINAVKETEVAKTILEACDKISQIEKDFLHYGYKEKNAETMLEHANLLRVLAKHTENEGMKHRHLLDAHALALRAISIEEEVFCDILSLTPLHESRNVSLPVMRKLADMKLNFVSLTLDMLLLVCTEEKKKIVEESRKGSFQRTVEEYVRSTPDYHSLEQEWCLTGKTLGHIALTQLESIHFFTGGSLEIKAKCLYLTGKCLRLLAIQVDPLNLDIQWNHNMEELKTDGLDNLEGNSEKEMKERQNARLYFKKLYEENSALLEYKKSLFQQYLSQATETLLQSINLGVANKFTDIVAAASLEMVECFGQFDPTSASQYLALYQENSRRYNDGKSQEFLQKIQKRVHPYEQPERNNKLSDRSMPSNSCFASLMMKEVLTAACSDTSNSQLAALLHLQLELHKGKGDGTSSLSKTLEQKLSSNSRAWENLQINPQHLNLLNEFPSNFNLIILHHSEDRSVLYGAILEKPKSNTGQKPKGVSTRAKVACATVNARTFSCLLEKVQLYKQEMMQLLLKRQYQFRKKAQQNKVEKLQKDSQKLETKGAGATTQDECKLIADFCDIVKAVEDYLKPVLSQLDLSSLWQQTSLLSKQTPLASKQHSPQVSAKDSKKTKEKESAADKGMQGEPINIGECAILLVDKLLMELPLEALKVLQEGGICSVSRDFSLQILYNRLHREEPVESSTKKDAKGAKKDSSAKGDKKKTKMGPVLPQNCIPVDANFLKYIVDPYNDASYLGATNCLNKMAEILVNYGQQFTPRWEGTVGSLHVPSHAEWEQMLTNCSAFIFCGTERVLASFSPFKLAAMNLSGRKQLQEGKKQSREGKKNLVYNGETCQIMILLDLVQTSHSFFRQSKLDIEKSALNLSLERPLETAILLSLTGIRCIMANQWHSILEQNVQTLEILTENLLKVGKASGQAVCTLKSGVHNLTMEKKCPVGPDALHEVAEASYASSGKRTEESSATIKPDQDKILPSAFNYVLYGLPNLVII